MQEPNVCIIATVRRTLVLVFSSDHNLSVGEKFGEGIVTSQKFVGESLAKLDVDTVT
jgi:hypothetical protein